MANTFKDKCINIASKGIVTIESNSCEIPEKYKTPVSSLITIMRNKMSILDKITIKFIEEAFDDMDKVQKALDENTENGEIPDGIINHLSIELYHKSFNGLTEEEQAIIKVLSCYLCIQN